MGHRVKVLAGDFLKGDGEISWGLITLKTREHSWIGEGFPLKDIESVEVATEESVKRVGGTVGWGVAGAALLGPLGLLAGLVMGGRGKDVTFVAKFQDGRKVLATTTAKGYQELLAATFK